jgi:A/G-specific adenine glycosylase
MELGALICKPNNPFCNKCPISKNCKSFIIKDFVLTKIKKKNKDKYFLLKVYKRNNKYLLVKNTRFNFLKNFYIFPMRELSKPKNFNQNLNFKMSNMNMNIKIENNKLIKSIPFSYWIDPKKLKNYTLPTFTKKIVIYLERRK